MKILFLILALLVLSDCANQTSADKIELDKIQPTPIINKTEISNANQWTPPPRESVDNAKLGKLEKQNAAFKIVPEEFSKVDFGNFKYPSSREKKIIPLKDGGYQYDYETSGGETYSLKNVYFLDLTGDRKKEAIVLLSVVSCGGSCDGGANFIYIYSTHHNKPKLIWHLETGSTGYGCGIKSMAIEPKKINIELFGRCSTGKNIETNSLGLSKFSVKDSTRLLYEFDGKKFVRKQKEYISVPERSVMNYLPEISISE